MSKLKSLVSKIELFEKLAFYGDRKDFLRAIAVTTPASDKMVQDSLVNLSALIRTWAVTKGDKQQNLGDQRGMPPALGQFAGMITKLSTYPKLSLENLKYAKFSLQNLLAYGTFESKGMSREAAESYGKEIFPKVRETMEIVSRQITNIEDSRFPEPEEASGQETKPFTMEEQTIVGTPQYATVSKDEQAALSKVLSVEGLSSPLTIDGVVGPATKAAIKKFKDHFSISQSMSDAEVLSMAKMFAKTDKYSDIPTGQTPSAVPDASKEKALNLDLK